MPLPRENNIGGRENELERAHLALLNLTSIKLYFILGSKEEMLAKQQRCYDTLAPNVHNKAILMHNAYSTKPHCTISGDFFDSVATTAGNLDPLFPVVHCIGPR